MMRYNGPLHDGVFSPAYFRYLRVKLGLSHDKFAELIDMGSGRNIRRWESGEKEIPGSVWLVLELIYSLDDVQEFLGLHIDEGVPAYSEWIREQMSGGEID